MACRSLLAPRDLGQAVPQGRLLVTDEDNSLLSHALTGAFGRGPLSKMVLVENVSREGGRDRINRGDGSAYLIFPRGFRMPTCATSPFGCSYSPIRVSASFPRSSGRRCVL